MVLQVLESGLLLVVKSGYLYLPLPFDPDMEREIQEYSNARSQSNSSITGRLSTILDLNDIKFVKSLDLQSIVENYERIDNGTYEKLKRNVLRESEKDPGLEALLPKGKLQTILLRIMPYFIRKNRGSERKRFNDEDMLDFLSDHVDIPRSFNEQVDRALDSGPSLNALHGLDGVDQTLEPPPEGPVSGDDLRRWIRRALEVRIVDREKTRLRAEVLEREQLGETKKKHMAALLYVAEKGSFEFDGFGFSRIGSRDDYVIYKRTGEYILKDYYARSYLFPDCRVAVSTAGPLRPIVLEHYKHPFLFGHAPRQEICMRGYEWPADFTADNIIRLLEDGINALLFGYDPRRRNGYHSLDPTLYYVKTIEFTEYIV